MKDNILLSIIIPYYNSDAWIGRMLDSLLDQDIPKDNYEIIVVDDGSTQSVDNLMYYTKQYPNIIYYRKENGGVSEARNLGIELAKGKWLYFCDSDDFVHPQVFGSLIKTAEDLSLDMLFCAWCVVQPDATIREQEMSYSVSDVKTGKDYIASFVNRPPMSIGFGMGRYFVKKDIIQDNGIRFDNISFTEDRIFQLDLLLVVNRVAFADINIYYYVQHQLSMTHEPKRRNYNKFAAWLWHYIERLSATMNDDTLALSQDAILVMDGWRDMAVFSLLINSFRYSPVSTTKDYLQRLSTIKGAYPIRTSAPKKSVRFVRRLMGHKTLWILLCYVYHIVPYEKRISI